MKLNANPKVYTFFSLDVLKVFHFQFLLVDALLVDALKDFLFFGRRDHTALYKKFRRFRRCPAIVFIRIVKWMAPNKVAVIFEHGVGSREAEVACPFATLLGAIHFTKTANS